MEAEVADGSWETRATVSNSSAIVASTSIRTDLQSDESLRRGQDEVHRRRPGGVAVLGVGGPPLLRQPAQRGLRGGGVGLLGCGGFLPCRGFGLRPPLAHQALL